MNSRKLLITLLVISLMVVYYILSTDYLKQRNESAELKSMLADAAGALAQVPETPGDLQARLDAARSSLEDIENLVPDRVNTTQVVNTILRLADEVQVKAIPLVTQPWTVTRHGDFDYSEFRLNVAVTGSFDRMVDFVRQLENIEYVTLAIEDLSITASPAATGDGTVDNSIFADASLDLVIYARSPPASL